MKVLSTKQSKLQMSLPPSVERWSHNTPRPRAFGEFYEMSLQPEARLENCMSLQAELCTRLARGVVDLRSLPHGLAKRPGVRKAIDVYLTSIAELEQPDGLSSLDTLDSGCFEGVLHATLRSQSDVVRFLLKDVQALKREQGWLLRPTSPEYVSLQTGVDGAVTRFLGGRVGLGFLGQHLLQLVRGDQQGALELACQPAKVASQAAVHARALCRATKDQAPSIHVQETNGAQDLLYAPSSLRYVLVEVLKNACQAVVDRHAISGSKDPLPPVVCKVTGEVDQVVVTIQDQGVGISPENMDKVWEFGYTTATTDPYLQTQQAQVLSGYGAGLPLSKLFVQYFGGEMEMSSKVGQGTEVTIVLKTSMTQKECLPVCICVP